MYLYVVIFLLITYIIYELCFNTFNVKVKSSVDNNYYIIRRGNYQSNDFLVESANILALVNLEIQKLIKHLQLKYPDYNDDTSNSKHFYIKFLVKNYNHNILSEGNIDKQYTTYTIDKDEIRVCLRTRDSIDEPYDINLLLYVLLHELAHLCNYDKNGNPIIGHGKEFLDIFSFLIEEAIIIKVYKWVDYTKKPVEYCDMQLNSQILSKE
jgi:hypothetical protein